MSHLVVLMGMKQHGVWTDSPPYLWMQMPLLQFLDLIAFSLIGAFSALTVLVVRQEEHLVCKN